MTLPKKLYALNNVFNVTSLALTFLYSFPTRNDLYDPAVGLQGRLTLCYIGTSHSV